ASPLPTHGEPEQASSQAAPRRLPPPPPPKIPTNNGDYQAQSEHRNRPLSDGVNAFLHQNHQPSHNADLRHAATTQALDSNLSQTHQEIAEDKSHQGRSLSEHRAESSHVQSGNSSQHDEISSPISKPVFDSSTELNSTRSDQPSRFSHDTEDQSQSSASDQGFGTPKDAIQVGVRESFYSASPGRRGAAVATNEKAQDEQPKVEAWGAEANNQGQAQGDDSFYWHSPHSTASMSNDHDQDQDIQGTSSFLDATPEAKEEQTYAPPIDPGPEVPAEPTTVLYQSILGPYSASALGFGGPSDWEHFGDYDAEEVDDTDLYIRPRSLENQKASIDSSELPANSALEESPPKQQPDVINGSKEFKDRASNQTIVQPQATASIHNVESKDLLLEQDDRNSKEPDRGDQPDLLASAAESNFALSENRNLGKVDVPPALSQPPVTQHLVQEPEQVKQPVLEAAVLPANASIDEQSADKVHLHEDEALVVDTDYQRWHTVNRLIDPYKIEAGPSSNTQDLDTAERPVSHPVSGSRLSSEQQQHRDVAQIPETQTLPRDSTKRLSLVSNASVLSKTKQILDPYGDLDPWARSSLNRYVAMLREESQGPTDAEKLQIFMAFSQKELKLRAVLYSGGNDQGDTLSATSNDGPSQGLSSLTLRRPASKALPALPPDADHSERMSLQNAALVSHSVQAPSPARLTTTGGDKKDPRLSGEDTYVMVDTPGGWRQQLPEETMVELHGPGDGPIPAPASTTDHRRNVVQPVSEPGVPDPPRQNSTIFTDHASEGKPAYTPFRYSQGYIDDSDQPMDRRASYRPYAALKLELVEHRAASVSQGPSASGHGANLRTNWSGYQFPRPGFAQEHHPSDSGTQHPFVAEEKPSAELRRFERADFDPLVAVLPSSDQIPRSAVELPSYQRGVDAVPDDFSFIHQHVVAWDAKAKTTRGQHEKERHTRQAESEQRIDALFNDDEIGYGDIAELESEFKRAEAARKTEEDRAEYQAFVAEVFDAVWTRLHYEIDQLNPLYDEYTDLAHETLAGRDMFETTRERFALAPTMSALLTLHQKLEMRHQKAFEAVLERDRKLKKTEMSPWYTLANVAKVKQLENQFEHAERKAIVDYCKQRDQRANRLMDVLDQNTLRG
ncbi:MAG: hypothetical protein Q9183_000986, partial [Haloplaca sp. 2 TL-2023]